MHELTTRDGDTTALLANMLRCWSSEKMRRFARQALARAVESEGAPAFDAHEYWEADAAGKAAMRGDEEGEAGDDT